MVSTKNTAAANTDTTTGESAMTTTTEIAIVSLTVLETYDKPRRCQGGCEKQRKTHLLEIATVDASNTRTTFTQVTCNGCWDTLKDKVGKAPAQPTRMEREIEDILRQQEERPARRQLHRRDQWHG